MYQERQIESVQQSYHMHCMDETTKVGLLSRLPQITQLVSGGLTWAHTGSSYTLHGTVPSSDYGKGIGRANVAAGKPVRSSF